MRNPGEIWRLRVWVWAPALFFFLANATAYSIYRFGFADRVAALEDNLREQRERLEPLEARKKKLEGLLELSRRNQIEIERLYGETFATRRQRLTEITAEVKSLARKAGLNPTALSYPEQQIQQYGLVKRSFIFSVEGTYLELRRFINLLEVSNSFLTLEEVTLSQGSEGAPVKGRGGAANGNPESSELRINLTLSTLFAGNPGEAEPTPALRGAK